MEEQKTQSRPQTDGEVHVPLSRWVALAWVVVAGLMLTSVYWPFLTWLGTTSFRMEQLRNGAILVIVAMVICLRGLLDETRVRPNLNNRGIALLIIGAALTFVPRWIPKLAFPIVVLSFCVSFAAVIAFLFGKQGVRHFMPALAGFLVFGLLVGLFPTLDWPLREIAARYSAALLTEMNLPVQVAAVPSRTPEILLAVKDRLYVVATECNGFGLLTSALLVATILGFRYHLHWVRKLGLFAMAVPVAIIFNFLRIVGICLVVPRVNISYNVIHEGVGTIFYLAGLAIIWYAAGNFADRTVGQTHAAVSEKHEQVGAG